MINDKLLIGIVFAGFIICFHYFLKINTDRHILDRLQEAHRRINRRKRNNK